ncbi:MAG: (deoxy)nucleoside triphosphate pyrophosphohydrolase [Minwuia sp.]|nr:(deoxy)nucleoside triphosphate pyrophosphohydrolase [Minwuia sp.]
MKLILVAAIALVRDARVLLAERPTGKSLAGLWEFPGGKVEAGETPETCLARECLEELGITVREQDLTPLTFASHTYETFHLLMPLYACHAWQGELTGREGQRLAWASAAELETYPMPPADDPLLPAIRTLL